MAKACVSRLQLPSVSTSSFCKVRPILYPTAFSARFLHRHACSMTRNYEIQRNPYLPHAQLHPSLRIATALKPYGGSIRKFTTTQSRYRDHHFDTLKFVQRLKDEGFSEDQSTAMMLVLSDVIEESIQNLTRTMVLREGATTFRDPTSP